MTAVIAASGNPFIDRVVAAIVERDPRIDIYRDLHDAPVDRIEALISYRPFAPSLPPMPRLRFALSPGAGVDGLLECVGLPSGLPIVRVCDPQQAHRMAQYVTAMVLMRWRALDTLRERQCTRTWRRDLPDDESSAPVAVLGYGLLGRATAHALAALGFDVTAWTRTPRAEPNGDVAIASGMSRLDSVLSTSRFVVVLLPLVDETRGLLDRTRLALLRRDAYVINASRAALIDEAALLGMLRSDRIAGAALDVFSTEPLPADSPWWTAPNVTLTPHIAAFPRADFVAQAFIETLRSAQAGAPLANVVARAR